MTDTPVRTTNGRPLIRRVEKILMPNGGYRYPVTYIDMTHLFRIIELKDQSMIVLLNRKGVPDVDAYMQRILDFVVCPPPSPPKINIRRDIRKESRRFTFTPLALKVPLALWRGVRGGR